MISKAKAKADEEAEASRLKMRKFLVSFHGTAEIQISDDLLRTCNTDEWRAQIVKFTTVEEFAQHIAYNMILNDLQLESIDGYADQPKERVKIIRVPDWDVEAEEMF